MQRAVLHAPGDVWFEDRAEPEAEAGKLSELRYLFRE
jgi:hypothetical protein